MRYLFVSRETNHKARHHTDKYATLDNRGVIVGTEDRQVPFRKKKS